MPSPAPIPLPIDRFTLPVIKNVTENLAACDLILYWLRRPGFSTARSDSVLITDSTNALASQFWEGQIRTALKDGGDARFLFENMGSAYYDKGFEMLQVLEDHYRPSYISNTFTTLILLVSSSQRSSPEALSPAGVVPFTEISTAPSATLRTNIFPPNVPCSRS
jgi:hypothetical protein